MPHGRSPIRHAAAVKYRINAHTTNLRTRPKEEIT